MEITDKTTIEIPLKEYRELIDRDEQLAAFEECGVDKWEGYEKAMDEYAMKRNSR